MQPSKEKDIRRPKAIIVVVVLALLAFSTLGVFVSRGGWVSKISTANYQRLSRTMDMDRVEQLLGTPGYHVKELGKVTDTGEYVTNATLSDQEKLRKGYRQYHRKQWVSRQITIVVVFDESGMVATRYSNEGQDTPAWWNIW